MIRCKITFNDNKTKSLKTTCPNCHTILVRGFQENILFERIARICYSCGTPQFDTISLIRNANDRINYYYHEALPIGAVK